MCSCSKDDNTATPVLSNTNLKVSPINNHILFEPFPSVAIGSQVWATKNLTVSTYRDGTPIPQVANSSQWQLLTTGAWCYYNNLTANGITYGKLYNWYAVAGIYDVASLADPALRKNLAPTGWHIPTDAEWSTLTSTLGGSAVAGGKMKETGTLHWDSPNTNATNSSGFTGFPGGARYFGGTFGDYFGSTASWWSSTEKTADVAWNLKLVNDDGKTYRNEDAKGMGWNVRCIKN